MGSSRRALMRALASAALALGSLGAVAAPADAAACPVLDPVTRALTADVPSGADWSGCDLHGLSAVGAWFDHVDFSGANLSGALLSGSTMASPDFTGADLTDVVMNVGTVISPVLQGADLTGITLYRSVWTGATGTPAALPAGWGVRAGWLLGKEVDAHGADLHGQDLHGMDLFAIKLANANLTGADLSGADLTGADLTVANLTDAIATGADFDSAWTQSAVFDGAHVENAVFDNLNGRQAFYAGMHAAGATFVDAALGFSTWTDADLTGADFTRASFFDLEIGLGSATVTGAIWTDTICSDGRPSRMHMDGTCVSPPDLIAPTTAMTAPAAAFALSTSLALGWSATDAGTGVLGALWQWNRTAAGGTAVSGWSSEKAVVAPAHTAVLAAAPGYRYCFRARAVDLAENIGAYAAARCTTVPVDDFALAASTGWVRTKSASGYLARTFTTTKTLGASLRTTRSLYVRQVGVVATRCATCGSVAVYVGATKVGTISLYSRTTVARALLVLPRFSVRRAGVVKLVATTARTVRIDGLAVTAV